MQTPFKNITLNELREALKRELPGINAQLKMVPEGRELFPNHTKVKQSAVLMLLYPGKNGLHLCLTIRNLKLKHHPGQISFPGGKCEPGESPLETAFRETLEEIGIAKEEINLIGQLSEIYVSVSNFNIHPFVAYIAYEPDFRIDKREVEDVLSVRLADIMDPTNCTTATVTTSFGAMTVPCYSINGHIIWGATSMMIAELEAILKQDR